MIQILQLLIVVHHVGNILHQSKEQVLLAKHAHGEAQIAVSGGHMQLRVLHTLLFRIGIVEVDGLEALGHRTTHNVFRSGVRMLTGGSTPKASALRKITFSATGPALLP